MLINPGDTSISTSLGTLLSKLVIRGEVRENNPFKFLPRNIWYKYLHGVLIFTSFDQMNLSEMAHFLSESNCFALLYI